MADADEDVINQAGASAEEIDLSDEIQDFRFLATISRENASIPKRGEKDFEPHATALQSNSLAASRQAMHNALSFQRVHQPKSQTRATYHPETNTAYAYNPKGPLFAKMGRVMSAEDDPLGNDELRGRRLWLLPEEVLYLLDRGSLDVRWPKTEYDEDLGLPMSLQGAYAMLIGDEESHAGALTFERYSVYSGLKRMGYIVLRAPTWDDSRPSSTRESHTYVQPRLWHVGLVDFYAGWKSLFAPASSDRTKDQISGPVVPNRRYGSYADIYRRLALVNYHDPASPSLSSIRSSGDTDDPPIHITYHIWKPGSPTFKKSAPGTPDFRIAVLNARETDVPTLQQISSLVDTLPDDPPKQDNQLYQKLKHGYKNVILAVVDQGVVSYLRFADAAFGREKLYERKARKSGGKRGGGRGGRGRGR